jgi:hypothetical protein
MKVRIHPMPWSLLPNVYALLAGLAWLACLAGLAVLARPGGLGWLGCFALAGLPGLTGLASSKRWRMEPAKSMVDGEFLRTGIFLKILFKQSFGHQLIQKWA